MHAAHSSSCLLLPIRLISQFPPPVVPRWHRQFAFPLQNCRQFYCSNGNHKRFSNWNEAAGRPWTEAELEHVKKDATIFGIRTGLRLREHHRPLTVQEKQGWQRRSRRRFYIGFGFGLLVFILTLNEKDIAHFSPRSDIYLFGNEVFDPPKFTPFSIVSNEEVSPTSFIITVRPKKYAPQSRSAIADPYAREWSKGTWSVEFKQPELQIARSYTPLPPLDDNANGELRFLIRREANGEMSRYLARLKVGSEVELRGPHAEVDLPDRVTDVVFLAGGTGIAPALQTVHTLLKLRDAKSTDRPNIFILWANRRREDCVGGTGILEAEPHPKEGPIVRELRLLQENYPDNLRVGYLVDEEDSVLNERTISGLTKKKAEVKPQALSSRIDRRLLFVSGPEGFVNYVAGPKKYMGGKEVQGELGGLLGKMGIRDWKVWKQ